MNQRLSFSWAHIIAFLAIIAVCYISFMGFTYLTDGNFAKGVIGMTVTAVVFLIVFITPQQLKIADTGLSRKIVIERIFIFASPFVFIAGMVAMSHFWTVRAHNDEITARFTESIAGSRQLFTDYERYTDARMDAYSRRLSSIIARQTESPAEFAQAGFTPAMDSVQKANMEEILKVHLRSQNYDRLKEASLRWIDNADRGATVWNVFLIGNTQEIKSALKSWERQLQQLSARTLSNESSTEAFASEGVRNAIAGIDSLTATFTTLRRPTGIAIVFGIVIYLMLLFPYIIQERNCKSDYRLFGDRIAGGSAANRTTYAASAKDDLPRTF